jgi:hypothetical protein
MDPITIAMGLSQFAPAIVKWMTGSDKAEEAAQAVVGIAQQVTGKQDPVDALASITGNAQLQLEFRKAVMANEADLDKAYLADRQNARGRDVALAQAGRRNVRADVMVALAFVAVIAIAALMVFGKIDGNSAAGGFLVAVGGMFTRNIGTAFDFEFGSSRGSQDKDSYLAQFFGRSQGPKA